MKKVLVFLIISTFLIDVPCVIKAAVPPKTPSKIDKSLESDEESDIKKFLKSQDAKGIDKEFQKKLDALKKDAFERLTKVAKDYTFTYFKKKLENPNAGSGALVRQDTGLSTNERLYRTKRIKIAKDALEKFFGQELDIEDDDFRIGFVGTGGGYRAMILTIGYLVALQYLGLYDALIYLTSLSGSTWAVAPMISLGLNPEEYKERLLDKVRNKQFNILKLEQSVMDNSTNIQTIVNSIIWPKFVYGQPIRSIDFYGFLLSQVLFGQNGYKQYLSDQWNKVRDGKVPFPIYTAISMSQKEGEKYSYDWWEFNPIDVRVTLPVEDQSLNFSIPSYSFGSAFNAGKSTEIAPEQNLGYLLGTFGSAYSINFKDISRFVAGGISKLETSMFSLDKVKFYIAASVVNIIKELEVGKMRFSPAQVFNPLKGMDSVPDWLQEKELLTLVDAGIEYNIPARPLLWPARKLKVLIIGESSTSTASAEELKKFFADAQATYGYNYKRIDDGSNKTIRLYKDLDNPKAPRIIYITFLKDESLMAAARENKELEHLIQISHLDKFDPIQCLESSFCGTFNFEYTLEQLLQLMAMAEFNIRANEKVIRPFLWDEIIENLEDINFPVFGKP
jgi:hypothetical protein